MKTTLSRFFRNLIVFTLAVAATCAALFIFIPALCSPMLPWLLVFFFVITLAVFYISLKASREKLSRFVNFYMVMSMLKIFMLLVVTAIYLYLRRDDALRFSVSLLVLFFAYLIFEVIWLLKIRGDN